MIFGELPITRRSQQTPPPDRRGGQLRLIILIVLIVVSFSPVTYQLYQLQGPQQQAFRDRIIQRSNRPRSLPATRGLIYDRTGQALVRNAPAYQIAIIPASMVNRDNDIQTVVERTAMYNRLAQMINQPGITAGEIYTRVVQQNRRNQPYDPVVIAENVPRDIALSIQEQALYMRGVVVQNVGSRFYPYKELLGNMLGYTARIPAGKLPDYQKQFYTDTTTLKPRRLYEDDDRVGVLGLEKRVEPYVRGIKGYQVEERDASGEVRRVLNTITATAGSSVYLTLDLRLQKIISDALIPIMQLRNSPRGAVVVLNPNTGEILGMISVPDIDNNLFARGITQKELDLYNNKLTTPQYNHATQEHPNPGSTFKIISAFALLQEGAITPDTIINDPGVFFLPPESNDRRPFYCWIGLPPRNGSHGPQTVSDALRNSCNTFFRKGIGGYKPEGITALGGDPVAGAELLAKWANEFGVGEDYPEEFDLPYEAGVVPTRDYLLNVRGQPWFTGDSYNAAIGQGDVGVTPLQMANIMATVANGGTLYMPQIIREVKDSNGGIVRPFVPRVIRQVRVSPDNMQLVQNALRRVVSPDGTAVESQIAGFEFAGKTGTAEFCDGEAKTILKLCGLESTVDKPLPTHAWFVAYAPAVNPQIAISVYIWNGGQGSGVAAPVAQRIINEYFNLKVPPEKLKRVKSLQEERDANE